MRALWHICLGSLGLLTAVAPLTCGGMVLDSWSHPARVPLLPVIPRTIWHANGTVLSPRSSPWRSWAEDCPSLSQRQSATMAGQPTVQVRVPRCTPAGLSHAVRRRPEQVSTADPWFAPGAITSLSRSNLGGGAALGWCVSHLRRWSAGVRACPPLSVGVATQLDTHPAGAMRASVAREPQVTVWSGCALTQHPR